MIRTPSRGVVAAGAALGTVSLAVGVLGTGAAEAASKPAETSQTVAATGAAAAATSREIAAERKSLSQEAAAVAKVAGATATTPPRAKAKTRPPGRPVAKVRPRKLTPREMAQQLVTQQGWSEAQFTCLDELWNRESGWDPHNENGGSGAYGIPQSLPGRKMAQFGSDWRDNPMTQIRWGLWYIADRYSTPCGAWAHSQRYNYY